MASSFHLAQVNKARRPAPVTDSIMTGLVARLAEINHLTEASPGFGWRLTEDVNPFDPDILFNLSLWESRDERKQFNCLTSHKKLLAARQEWFWRFDGRNVSRWWIPARAWLEHLREQGDSPYAFRIQSELDTAAVA